MSRIFAFAGVAVAGLIVFGLALGWLLLPALSDSEIKQAVARETGRSISFAGRPRLSIWPELGIELRNVELSNPPEMGRGRFAAADTVRLKVSAASLWRRAPEVTEMIVERPRINLLVDSEGRSNFAFEREGGTPEETDMQAAPIIIVDGSVKYLNERSAAAFAASDLDVTILRSGLAGPIELEGAFNWNDQRLTIAFHAKSSARLTGMGSPADFTIAGPYLSAAFSGRAALRQGLELAGRLQFKAEPLADLLSWAGLETAHTGDLPALSTGGAVDLSGGAIRMTQADLEFGATRANGDVALSFAGPRPHLTADLDVDRIDLAALADENPERDTATWSEAPLDLAFLNSIDAELSLAVAELAYGGFTAAASRLAIGLADGTLDAALTEAEVYGGQASGRLILDGSGQLAVVEATFDASGVDGGRLAAALTGSERIRGQADIDFDLSASGASRQELIAMLGGQARLRIRDGALVDVDVPALIGHVASEVAEGWAAAGERETPFADLEASFTVRDGIAEIEEFRIDGPVAQVSGTGSIDALRRRVDLRVRPRTMGQEGKTSTADLPVAVVVAGSWSAPQLYPDVPGILEDPEQGYRRLEKLIELNAAKLDFGPETIKKGDRSEPAVTR